MFICLLQSKHAMARSFLDGVLAYGKNYAFTYFNLSPFEISVFFDKKAV